MGITRDGCDLCFAFNIIRCKFFFGVFRLTPLWFCHSWNWSHMIFFVLMKEIRFVQKLVSTGKWASEQGNCMRPVVFFVSRSLFLSWNIWGILAQRGKTFSFYVIFCESEMKTRTTSEYIEQVYYKFISLFLPRSSDQSVIMYMEMYLVNVATNE